MAEDKVSKSVDKQTQSQKQEAQIANEKRDALFKEVAKNVKGGEATLKEIRESKKTQEETKQKMNDLAEAQGLTLDEFKKSVAGQEMQFKIDKEEKRAKRLTDAKDLSMQARQFALSAKQLATFEGMKNAFSGLSETLLKIPGAGAVVGATRSLFGVLKNLALIALIPLLVKFLNSQTFKDMANYLITNGAKIMDSLYNTLISFFTEVGKILTAFAQDGFLGGIRQISESIGFSKEDIAYFKETVKNLGLSALILGLGSVLVTAAGFIASMTNRLRMMFGIGTSGAAAGKLSLQERGFKKGKDYTLKGGRTARFTGKGFQEIVGGKPGQFLANKDVLENLKGGQGTIKSGSRIAKFIGIFKGVSRIIHGIGKLLAINELIQIATSGESKAKKVEQFVGLLGGLGGSALGALVGGIAGSAVPLVGNLIGATVGGGLGFFGGEILTKALAQYLVGGPVDAFPVPFEGYDLNEIFNRGMTKKNDYREDIVNESGEVVGYRTTQDMGVMGGIIPAGTEVKNDFTTPPSYSPYSLTNLGRQVPDSPPQINPISPGLGFGNPFSGLYNYIFNTDNSSTTTAVNGTTSKVDTNPLLPAILER